MRHSLLPTALLLLAMIPAARASVYVPTPKGQEPAVAWLHWLSSETEWVLEAHVTGIGPSRRFTIVRARPNPDGRYAADTIPLQQVAVHVDAMLRGEAPPEFTLWVVGGRDDETGLYAAPLTYRAPDWHRDDIEPGDRLLVFLEVLRTQDGGALAAAVPGRAFRVSDDNVVTRGSRDTEGTGNFPEGGMNLAVVQSAVREIAEERSLASLSRTGTWVRGVVRSSSTWSSDSPEPQFWGWRVSQVRESVLDLVWSSRAMEPRVSVLSPAEIGGHGAFMIGWWDDLVPGPATGDEVYVCVERQGDSWWALNGRAGWISAGRILELRLEPSGMVSESLLTPEELQDRIRLATEGGRP